MPGKPEEKSRALYSKSSNPIRDKAGKGKKKKKPTGTKGGKGKPARTEKPGVPHGVDKKDSEGVTILEVARGGSVTGRSIGPAGASIVSDDGKRIKQLKKIAKSVGIPGAVAGLTSGVQKTVKKLAGRLATRGYGKARK